MADDPVTAANDITGMKDLHLGQLTLTDYLKIEPKLSAEQKAALAVFLARSAFSQDRGQSDEAESIIQLIIWNSEVEVAETIAGAAALESELARPVVWMLANEDARVAAPVLEKSAVLTDEDLVGIIAWSGSTTKMNAIARRPAVTEVVSHSLVSHGDETTAVTLLENTGAVVSADAFDVMLDRFGELEKVQDAIVGRNVIYSSTAQRLLSLITNEDTKAALAARETVAHTAPASAADLRALGLDAAESEQTLAAGVDVLLKNKALTEPVLADLLLEGSFELFVRALARKTQSDVKDTRQRVMDASAEGLKAGWAAAGLSAEWLPLVQATLHALGQLRDASSVADARLFRRNLYTLAGGIMRRDGVKLKGSPLDFFTRHKPK